MDRRIVVGVALALAVVLAGCSGLGGLVQDGSTTPADTADDAGGDSERTLAPGVNGSTVTNVSALLWANSRRLNATSFAADNWINASFVTETNGSVPDIHAWTFTDGNHTYRYGFDRYRDGSAESIATWSNGTVAVERHRARNGSVRFEESTPAPLFQKRGYSLGLVPEDVAVRRTVWPIAVGEFEVTDTRGSGDDARITLVAEGANRTRVNQSLFSQYRDYEARLVIDGTGLVRTFTATVTSPHEGRDDALYRARIQYDLEQVGNVTVERPDWIDSALGATAGTGRAE